jgi:hypothetical protein
MAKFTGLSCDAGRLGQLVDARVATLAGHIMLPIIAERYARPMPLRALPTPQDRDRRQHGPRLAVCDLLLNVLMLMSRKILPDRVFGSRTTAMAILDGDRTWQLGANGVWRYEFARPRRA